MKPVAVILFCIAGGFAFGALLLGLVMCGGCATTDQKNATAASAIDPRNANNSQTESGSPNPGGSGGSLQASPTTRPLSVALSAQPPPSSNI
jgi:hypothetical protein